MILVVFVSGNASATTTIGQDVYAEAPVVQGLMNTQSEADSIYTQLTSVTKNVSLSEDKVEGNYSVKVTAGDETGQDYVAYTLVSTDVFNIAEYSEVTIYIKPAMGAKWIQFYTNSALILGDATNDGKFEVGQDIKSGVWNKITLDLTKAQGGITQGDDLTVRTNKYSTWYYDNVTSHKTPVTSIDLSRMDYSQVRINNGRLEFNPSTTPMFDVTPVILVSNQQQSFEMTRTDFSSGMLDAVTLNSNKTLKMYSSTVDSCTGGTAISGGDYSTSYPPSQAFDDSTSTTWRSLQTGTSVSGNAYVGYTFSSPKMIRSISIRQDSSYLVSSVKLQYFEDSTWKDAQTLGSLDGNDGFTITSLASAQQWRFLANANTSSSYSWRVTEIEMYTYGQYTSPVMDTSQVLSVASSEISWIEKEGSGLKVETNLSLDGGTTWQGWQEEDNGGNITGINSGTDLSNSRLQYRVSVGNRTIIDPTLYKVTISIKGQDYNNVPSFESGKLEKISIDSAYANVNGLVETKPLLNSLSSISTSNFCLSGDGDTLYYSNSSDGYLYRMNLNTGASSKVGNYTGITEIQVNYDGTIAAYKTGSNQVVYYNDNKVTKENLLSSSSMVFSLQNNGSVVYVIGTYTSGSREIKIYSAETESSTSINTYSNFNTMSSDHTKVYMDAPQNGNIVYFSLDNTTDDAKKLYRSEKNSSGWNTSSIYTASNKITSIFSNDDGSKVYFSDNYFYDNDTKTIRKLDIDFTIKKVLTGDRLFGVDSYNNVVIYDVMKGEKTISQNISDLGTVIGINDAGTKIEYLSTGGVVKTILLEEDKTRENYLLSFDGKNTWCSFIDGELIEIDHATPTADDFSNYGMTADEVNALDADDFAQLYDDGRDIYTVDVAIYFKSDDPYITPSIGSISVITNEEDANSIDNLAGQALYAAKKADFDGSDWRKIKRIYPIELTKKEATFYYFVYVNGAYSYYDGTQWQTETAGEITNYLTDVQIFWPQITAVGMAANDVKSIPEASLTSQLAGEQFSVVYAMKVFDDSTENYSCIVNADYVEDFFDSDTLTLNIIMNDGTTSTFSTLSAIQVEDFMEWISNRQHGRGPVFYTIKVGSMNYFINYYMIQSVKVEEQ